MFINRMTPVENMMNISGHLSDHNAYDTQSTADYMPHVDGSMSSPQSFLGQHEKDMNGRIRTATLTFSSVMVTSSTRTQPLL